MKRIYRGDLTGLSAMEAGNTSVWGWGLPKDADQTGQPAPYMLYRKDSRQEEEGRLMRRPGIQAECDYFKGLYPQSVRRHQGLVEEACDRLDYEGSPMFDEYPDREMLYRVRDEIEKRASDLGMDCAPDMMLLLLANEMNRRRMMKRD